MEGRILPESNAAPRFSLKVMNLLLFLLNETVPWITLPNVILFFGILLSIINAIVILKSRQREEAHTQQVALSKNYKENWENALKEKDRLEKELQKSNEAKEKSADEADIFRGSYTALASVNIKELIGFDKLKRERDALELECIELQQQIIRKRVK